MIESARHEPPYLARPLLSAARRILPWVVLTGMLLLVGSYYGRYRADLTEFEAAQVKPGQATRAAQAARASKTAPPKAAAAKPSQVVVVSDVTFRKGAEFSADAIRDLKTGEALTLLSKTGEWYKVKDRDGTTGFVTASAKYTKLVAGK